MLRGSFRIGRLFGIPIEINVSWLLILVLVAWSVADGYFGKGRYEDLSDLHRWLLGVAAALMLFTSILLHELMHSVVAIRNGLPVVEDGRLVGIVSNRDIMKLLRIKMDIS